MKGLKPVIRAVAASTRMQPGSMPAVTGSPRKSPPQLTPNSGIMNAADVAALAVISRISRMLIQYMKPDVKMPRMPTATRAPVVGCALGAARPPGRNKIAAAATCTAADAGKGEWASVARFIRIAPTP